MKKQSSRHDGCREHSLEHYALAVSTSAFRIGRFNSGIEKDRVETEKLGQMFLHNPGPSNLAAQAPVHGPSNARSWLPYLV